MKRLLLITALLFAPPALAEKPVLEVYKSPSCGCCGDWVDHMKENGFEVRVHDRQNLHPIKLRGGIQPGLGSCHTGFVGGYTIEGHVPAQDVKRLLEEQPDARGLAVPGMPMGSPGMEGPREDAYEVLLFREDAEPEVFNSYP